MGCVPSQKHDGCVWKYASLIKCAGGTSKSELLNTAGCPFGHGDVVCRLERGASPAILSRLNTTPAESKRVSTIPQLPASHFLCSPPDRKGLLDFMLESAFAMLLHHAPTQYPARAASGSRRVSRRVSARAARQWIPPSIPPEQLASGSRRVARQSSSPVDPAEYPTRTARQWIPPSIPLSIQAGAACQHSPADAASIPPEQLASLVLLNVQKGRWEFGVEASRMRSVEGGDCSKRSIFLKVNQKASESSGYIAKILEGPKRGWAFCSFRPV